MELTCLCNPLQESKQGDHKSDVQMDAISVNSVEGAMSMGLFSTTSSRDKDHAQSLYESDESDEFDENAGVTVDNRQKYIRLVEKITESRAFQKLTDVGVVRRAMENVSETDLCLTVVVERLAGKKLS